MRSLLAILLCGLGLGAMALSAWINGTAGHVSGVNAESGQQLAALFVLIDLGKVGFLTAATLLLAQRARVMALVLGVAGLVLLALSFTNVAGRVAQMRASTAGAIETGAQLASDARAELDRLKDGLMSLGIVEPAAALSARLQALRIDRRWQATSACIDATRSESREWCAAYRSLEADLARSLEAGRLEGRIAELRSVVAETGAASRGIEGDWTAALVARFSGLGNTVVRDVFALMAALGIELVASLAFPAAVRLLVPTAASQKPEGALVTSAAPPSEPATAAPMPAPVPGSEPAVNLRPVGDLAQFAAACLANQNGSTIAISQLYRPYTDWCAGNDLEPVPELAFRRVFAQLCGAVGYRTSRRGNSVRVIGVGLAAP